MKTLDPVRSSTLKVQVVGAIRGAIFAGKFAPGDALRELHLARDLNVSQPTVREALFELEKHGLVVRTPNVGTIVTNLSTAEMREQIELRLQLERVAAVKASERMTPADFRELEQRLAALTSAVAANAYYESAQADLDFHRQIWVCSGNRALAAALDRVAVPLFAFVSILRSAGSQDLIRVMNSHAAIVDALRKRDHALLERLMAEHCQSAYQEFLDSDSVDCRTYVQRRLSAMQEAV
ncbi:MAG: GntR family transcriptional regulator [Acidobacteria bacterium]|nr:GntR family transcriptional regulator [Acidobacteriota bacterium]